MADFPLPITTPYTFDDEGPVEDPTLSSHMEDGSAVTRARFTRLRRSWRVTYTLDNDAKLLLEAFQRDTTRGTAGSFTWIHPDTLYPHTVRFGTLVRFPRFANAFGWWAVPVTFVEV